MKTRKFSFRLDDITDDMNWKNFKRIQEIFEKYEICPLLGVVPDNCDTKLKVDQPNPQFWKLMTELKENGWSFSQHGFQHRYTTNQSGMLGLKEASEFAGISYEEQKAMLAQGKKILEEHGIRTDILCLGHTFDELTLKALKDLGFHYVTDGYADDCYIRREMKFIPCKSAGKPYRKGIDTVCLHINGMRTEQFDELEKLIRENRKQIVNFSELLKEPFKPYDGSVARSEKRNLKKKKWKSSIAQNEMLQEYLRRHNSDNFYKKQISRILGLPWLFIRMAFGRRRK